MMGRVIVFKLLPERSSLQDTRTTEGLPLTNECSTRVPDYHARAVFAVEIRLRIGGVIFYVYSSRIFLRGNEGRCILRDTFSDFN